MLSAGIFLCFMLGMLTHADLSTSYAFQGLTVWARHAVPSLFPYMLLSGVIVRMGLADRFASILHPVLGRVYRCSKAGVYVIFTGFLCGFPMGSRTISELRQRGELSKREARFLLSFCNNLGPAYLCGFVLPSLEIKNAWIALAGAYGLPLCYGILLRNTVFRGSFQEKEEKKVLPCASFPEAFSQSLQSAIQGILTLGGYVVIFCLLNLIPHVLTGKPFPFLGPLFEITTGIMALSNALPVYTLTAISFGGLSCIAQTFDSLKGGDLKEYLGEYCLHKAFLALLNLGYYGIILRFSSLF